MAIIRLKDKEELVDFDQLIKKELGMDYEGTLDNKVWIYRSSTHHCITFNMVGGISTYQVGCCDLVYIENNTSIRTKEDLVRTVKMAFWSDYYGANED